MIHGQTTPPHADQAAEWQAMFRSCWTRHAREPHALLWNRATQLVRDIVPSEGRAWFYTSLAWREFMEHYTQASFEADTTQPRPVLRVHTCRWPVQMHEQLQQIAQAMGCSLNELTTRTMAALIPSNTQQDAQKCPQTAPTTPPPYKGKASLTSTTPPASAAGTTPAQHAGAISKR